MIDRFKIDYEMDSFVAGNDIDTNLAYIDTLTGDKLAEARVNIEYNGYQELETTSLDIVNQAPEFFEEIAKHNGHTDNDIFKQHCIVTNAKRLAENLNDDLPQHVNFHNVKDNIDVEIKKAEINEFKDEGFALYELTIAVGDKEYEAVLNLNKDDEGEYYVSHDGDSYDLHGGYDGTNKQIKEAVENEIKSVYGEKNFEEKGMKAVDSVLLKLELNVEDRLFDSQFDDKEVEEPKQKQKKSKSFGMSM